MRFILPLLLLSAILPAPELAAQTTYYGVPDSNAAAGSGNVIPFGNGSATTWRNQRYQSLAARTYLPTKPSLLRYIAFPPTGSGTFQYEAMIIRVGHNTSGSLSAVFENSFSTPPTTLLNTTHLDWQVTADTWGSMPLSPKPFIYNGKDNLVIEVVALGSHLNTKSSFHTGNSPRSYVYNFTLPTHVATYGTGCKGSNGKEPLFGDCSFPFIGADLYQVGLADAVPNCGAIYFLGTSRSSFGALTLPFDLGAVGAAGCFLNSRITLPFPAVTTTATGTALVNAAIPADPALEGATFYGQWLIADLKANPAGLVATKGLENMMTQVKTSRSGSSNHAVKVRLGFL